MKGRKAKHKARYYFNVHKQPCQMLVVGHLQKNFTKKLKLRTIRKVGSHLVMHFTVSLILGRRDAMGDGNPDVLHCCWLHKQHLHKLCRLVHFPSFFISGEALLPTGLCLICLKVTIFSLGAILYYAVISNGLKLRVLKIIILLSRRRWISY